jgi:hypothetical protein
MVKVKTPRNFLVEKAQNLVLVADKELQRAYVADKRYEGDTKELWIDEALKHLHEAIDNLLIWKKAGVDKE